MSPQIAGVLGFIFLLMLMAMGMPIAFAFIVIGFLGIVYLSGINVAVSAIARIPFFWSSNHIFTCIPLFVLMGFVFSRSGIARDLYKAAYSWLGRLSGGLALASVVGCGLFAAVTGSSTAGAATMSTIVYPEMRRYEYDKKLAIGTISAGGTLGIMIPPSIGFIIYALLSEESIGELFIAGIIPGILEVVFYCATIIALVKIKPQLAPLSPAAISWKEKFLSLKLIWPALFLFLVVMGGIYLGWFTPVEAGGIGAASAIVLSFYMRRLTLQGLALSLMDTARITVMIFLLIMGAMVFNVFLALSNLPQALGEALGAVGSPALQLALILLIYFPLGAFMDATAMFVLTVPLYLPMLVNNGINLVWFGILAVRCAEIGLITPPVGMNVYVAQGVIKEISVENAFKGIIPFLIADVFILLMLALFPQLSLLLPSLMRR